MLNWFAIERLTAQPGAHNLPVDHGLQRAHSLDSFSEKVFTHPDAYVQHHQYNTVTVWLALKIQPLLQMFFYRELLENLSICSLNEANKIIAI